jgi:3',5'-cyclic AMP phosphodiesterase CpdA
MIKQAYDPDQLGRYVEALRANLDAPHLQDAAARAAKKVPGHGDPVASLRAAIPSVAAVRPSSGGGEAGRVPFLARDPMVSLFQSSLDAELRKRGARDEAPDRRDLLARLVHFVMSLLHPVRYGPTDPDWVIHVGEAMLDRLAEGNHPFNPEPARHDISDDARIVVVGDWGSGVPRARDVARLMAEEVTDALAQGREAHVVHLGDVYYSGLPEEVERNVLAPGLWPVTADQASGGVTSWSLNGNHDMYGGGFGYFDTLLADERFRSQRSPDGKAASFFRLVSPSWDFVGLDTSWDPNVLAQGFVGALEDPQAEFVASVAGESGRKLMLLSHHQLISVYDTKDIGPTLSGKLAPTLDAGRVTAWLWGHEHRCMGFDTAGGVKFPRCIGHGGVPVLMDHPIDDPVPAPGTWEERGFLEYQGDHWARFGFAILDLAGDHIDIRYRDDQGRPTPAPETIV